MSDTRIYTTALTPASVPPGISEQLFTVKGVKAGDFIDVNKPTAQAGLAADGARTVADDKIGLTFINSTPDAITPTPAEAYTVLAVSAAGGGGNGGASDCNQFVFNGTTWEPFLTPSKFIALNNVQVSGKQAVWTPVPGKKFRLMGFQFACSVAGQVDFCDGVDGPIIYSVVVAAGCPNVSVPLGNGILSSTPGNPLVVAVSAGPGPLAFINGTLTGQEV